MSGNLNRLWPAAVLASFFVAEAGVAETSLSVGTVPGYPGATVSVPVSLRQGGSAVAAQFDVGFHAGTVSALAAVRGAQLTSHVIRSRQVAPGVERVLIYSLNNAAMPANNVTVASLPFTLSPTEYFLNEPLPASNVILAKADATAVTPLDSNVGGIFLLPVNPLPEGGTQVFLPATSGRRYVFQASVDLTNWSNLSTNVATNNFLDVLDADAANYQHRFYRWVSFDGPDSMDSINRLADGSVTFRITGVETRTYIVQASTDLEHWSDIATNAAIGVSLIFTDPDARNFSKRFYRLRSQ